MQAVILVGLQASGKSSLYRERFFTTHVRINYSRWLGSLITAKRVTG